jgi:flagellar motor switch protein FliN/FliY
MDAVARALTDALTEVCGARLGADATAAPSDLPAATGWLLTIPVSGAIQGRALVWFDAPSAAAYARTVAGGDSTVDEAGVQRALADCVHSAARLVTARPDLSGVTVGAPAIAQAPAPQGARAVYVAVPNTASCLFAVGVDRTPPAARVAADERLGAVLDVDLPLVVRFGHTTMTLRDLAALGPGSVIDMGRAPDEPVEMLVGERLLARGEVVVVGGNYGVRITELAAGRDRAAHKEA